MLDLSKISLGNIKLLDLEKFSIPALAMPDQVITFANLQNDVELKATQVIQAITAYQTATNNLAIVQQALTDAITSQTNQETAPTSTPETPAETPAQ